MLLYTSVACESHKGKLYLSMAFLLGKHHILSSLLFLPAFLSVGAKECPQLPPDTEHKDHVESVNKRLQKLSEDGQFVFPDSSNKYRYIVNLCKVNLVSMAVEQQEIDTKDAQSFNIGSYKDPAITGGSSWLMITYYGHDYGTHCGGTTKRSIFFIECDPSADTHKERMPQITVEYAPKSKNKTFCYYLFEMRHSAACSSIPKTKISPGSVFIIIIIIIAVLYLLLGFLYQRFLVGAKGLEQIPNYLLWREFGTLQADGCNYICRCKTARTPTRYKPMDDAIADDDDTDGEKDDALLPV